MFIPTVSSDILNKAKEQSEVLFKKDMVCDKKRDKPYCRAHRRRLERDIEQQQGFLLKKPNKGHKFNSDDKAEEIPTLLEKMYETSEVFKRIKTLPLEELEFIKIESGYYNWYDLRNIAMLERLCELLKYDIKKILKALDITRPTLHRVIKGHLKNCKFAEKLKNSRFEIKKDIIQYLEQHGRKGLQHCLMKYSTRNPNNKGELFFSPNTIYSYMDKIELRKMGVK